MTTPLSSQSQPVIALLSTALDMMFLKTPLTDYVSPENLRIWPQDPIDDADVAICWHPPAGVMSTLPRLRLIHSIAAGVDNILTDSTIPDLPVCRIVDQGHAQGMAQFALWATLYFHRQFDTVLAQQKTQTWQAPVQRAAGDVTVGIMGWGNLGRAVGHTLQPLGYKVRGWARSPKTESGIEMFHGDDGRTAFLSGCDILICLLPLTPETEGLMNADLFRTLPQGAAVINIGRGEQLVEDDLIAALDSGHLRGAVLDVFTQEPLPASHPLWSHDKVLVTPHMASVANPKDIAAQIMANVNHLYRGEPLANKVDRSQGY